MATYLSICREVDYRPEAKNVPNLSSMVTNFSIGHDCGDVIRTWARTNHHGYFPYFPIHYSPHPMHKLHHADLAECQAPNHSHAYTVFSYAHFAPRNLATILRRGANSDALSDRLAASQ